MKNEEQSVTPVKPIKYEDIIRKICGETWRDNQDEFDGGYGIACVMAFLDGAMPVIEDIAKFLDADPLDVEIPFRRLQATGIFSKRFNGRRDKCLNGWSSAQDGRTAWCHIAAIASGWIGQGYYIQHADAAPAPKTTAEKQMVAA